MNYWKLYNDLYLEDEFMEASPRALGAWHRLMRFCTAKENQGIIPGALHWSDQRWIYGAQLTRADVDAAYPLAYWKGEDLIVTHYPGDDQHALDSKRTGGKKGGRGKKAPSANLPSDKVSAPETFPDARFPHENLAIIEEEKRGEVRKEEEREGSPSPADAAPPVSEEEAWKFAKSQPVAPAWTKAMVACWWADRDFRNWTTASGTTIDASNWRKDLRNSHGWAQRAQPPHADPAHSGTFPKAQKKLTAPPDEKETPAHVDGLLALVRQRQPGFTGDWSDVPRPLQRAVQAEWNEALTEEWRAA